MLFLRWHCVTLRWHCCFCCRYCCCCWDRWGLLPLYCYCCCCYVDIVAFAVVIVAVVKNVVGYCRYIVGVLNVTLISLLRLSLLLLLLLLQWATAVILLVLLLLRWQCCFCCRYCCCCWDRWGLLPLYCWCCWYVDFAFFAVVIDAIVTGYCCYIVTVTLTLLLLLSLLLLLLRLLMATAVLLFVLLLLLFIFVFFGQNKYFVCLSWFVLMFIFEMLGSTL